MRLGVGAGARFWTQDAVTHEHVGLRSAPALNARHVRGYEPRAAMFAPQPDNGW